MNPEAISPEAINFLWTTFGWGGLAGGVVVAGLGAFRKMAPNKWAGLPRVARWGLGFLLTAGAAFAGTVATGSAWQVGLVTALGAGFAALGMAETGKTIPKASAYRSQSLKVQMPGPTEVGPGSKARGMSSR